MKYTVNWKTVKETDYRHTATNRYESDEYYIFKGKYNVCYSLYTSDKWHLIRKSDNERIHSCSTAKECKGVVEYLKKHPERENVGGSEIVFNEDFTDWKFKCFK